MVWGIGLSGNADHCCMNPHFSERETVHSISARALFITYTSFTLVVVQVSGTTQDFVEVAANEEFVLNQQPLSKMSSQITKLLRGQCQEVRVSCTNQVLQCVSRTLSRNTVHK